jgi:tetratricopeptide (TPR) repeat protein
VVITTGDVSSRISNAWDSFVEGREPEGPGVRFGATLGSQRYDYWRVSWHQFERAPLGGAGADNFQQDYLRERRSDQEPRYPHSLAVRTLAQTGIVGVLLLAAALAAALAGALRTLRARPAGFGAAAAVGGVAAFAYWLVHAMGDWLYEYPGVAALAFALLGVACALQPRVVAGRAAPGSPARGPVVRVGAGIAVALLVLAMLGPWLAERHITSAAAKWRADPDAAFDDLSKAASFNPLSDRPQLVAGTIALQMGDEERAREEFREALERNGRDTYALLELGVLTANAGDEEAGRALVARALELSPRDAVIVDVHRRLEKGEDVDVTEVNDALLKRSRSRLRVRP